MEREPISHRFSPWAVAIGVGLAGFVVNLVVFPVLPGVHFLFGMALALTVTLLLGPGPGALAALVTSLATIHHWGHGAAVLIFTLHAVAVGCLAGRMSPLAASIFYWVLIGFPLIWLTYGLFLGVPAEFIWPVAIKQPLNAWLNVLIASSIVAVLPRDWPLLRRLDLPPRVMSLQRLLLLVMVLLAVVPILLAGGTYGQLQWNQEERQLASSQRQEMQKLTHALMEYMDQRQSAVEAVARFLGRTDVSPSAQQALLDAIRQTVPGFINLYIGGPGGEARVFSPNDGPLGRSPVGENFSDRPYFQRLRQGERHVVSRVFQGRGGTDRLIVVMAEPITRDGRFAGYVLGAVDMQALATQLRSLSQVGHVRLVDHQRRYIVAPEGTDPGLEPATLPFPAPTGEALHQGSYAPVSGPVPAVQALDQRLLSYRQLPGTGWVLWTEASLKVIQERVQASYMVALAWMALGVLVTFLVSHALSRYLASPILLLATRSQAFAGGDADALAGPPGSRLVEIDALSRHLGEMALKVQQNQTELEIQVEARTAELQLANAQLTSAIEELRHLDRAKADFLNMVSHELRTPLNFITGFASILDDEVSGDLNETQHAHIRRILDGGERLLDLVNNLLDYARLEAGNFKTDPVPLVLSPLVDRVISDLEPLARQRQLSLACELSPTLPVVLADPFRLEQVLYNLIGNAIKFTPDGGAVRVEAALEGDCVRLAVIDTGIGIPAEALPHLFDRFYQVDSSPTRPYGGTGLGLAISRALIEVMGGQIGVESEVGRGTTFWFTLPRA